MSWLDEEAVTPPKATAFPLSDDTLAAMSLETLELYGGQLQAEIYRVEAIMAAKRLARGAAESFFKPPAA